MALSGLSVAATCFFQPIDAPKPIRIQGAFVSEQEVHRVVEVLVNEYGEPDEYLFDVYSDEDEEALMLGVKLDKKDPLFDKAVEVVRRKGYASASLLQRELEIGYPRAGKLIDQLEKAGIIGPSRREQAEEGAHPTCGYAPKRPPERRRFELKNMPKPSPSSVRLRKLLSLNRHGIIVKCLLTQ
jgi:DNA segregation ATPase FtsK/SpoIIIE-like protein